MSARFLALPLAVLASVTALPAFAQFASKPVYPRQGVMTAIVEVPSFASYRDLYAHLAALRGLAAPEGDLAVQQIESRVSIDHLRDYSGEPILVVKLEQPETPGLYSLFVVRQVSDRLRLIGQMSARSYETATESGHLVFVLDVGRRAAPPPRYQVDGDFLVDLAELANLDRDDPVQLDVAHAF